MHTFTLIIEGRYVGDFSSPAYPRNVQWFCTNCGEVFASLIVDCKAEYTYERNYCRPCRKQGAGKYRSIRFSTSGRFDHEAGWGQDPQELSILTESFLFESTTVLFHSEGIL